MKENTIPDLQYCSVRLCHGRTEFIYQRRIGNQRLLISYCRFHNIISGQFFQSENRKLIGEFVYGP